MIAHRTKPPDPITYYTSFIRENYNNPQAYLARGQAYLKAGKWSHAITDFNEAILLQEKNHQAPDFQPYLDRGMAYLRSNRPDKASLDFFQAVRLQPNNITGYYNLCLSYGELGRSLETQEKYDQAIQYFTKAIRVFRSVENLLRREKSNRKEYFVRMLSGFTRFVAEAFVHRGRCRLEQGNQGMAEKDFNLALQLNTRHLEARLQLGQIFLVRGEIGLALENFAQVVQLAPTNFKGYVHRALAFSWLGETAMAEQDYLQAKALNPSSSPEMDLALAAIQRSFQAATLSDIKFLRTLQNTKSLTGFEVA